MKITKDDERNIAYWAGRYSSNQAPFEDLQQEGRLAILQVEDASHKYLAMRNAIQEYARKEARYADKEHTCKNPYGELIAIEDEQLQRFEDLDFLRHVLTTTKLTAQESTIVASYFLDGKSCLQIADEMSIRIQRVYDHFHNGLEKLRRTANACG